MRVAQGRGIVSHRGDPCDSIGRLKVIPVLMVHATRLEDKPQPLAQPRDRARRAPEGLWFNEDTAAGRSQPAIFGGLIAGSANRTVFPFPTVLS